jgi:hypothetical protein
LIIYDPASAIAVYRSERIPGLYPQQYVTPPNGVGSTLRIGKDGDSAELIWTDSPVDGAHDMASYYVAYVSGSPVNGFSILDTTQLTQLTAEGGSLSQFFKITAVNAAGTSGDAPAP